MDQLLKNRVAALLAEAEQALDPQANGLLASGDLKRVIAKFIVTTRRVITAHEGLEHERDELSTRLMTVSYDGESWP